MNEYESMLKISNIEERKKLTWDIFMYKFKEAKEDTEYIYVTFQDGEIRKYRK